MSRSTQTSRTGFLLETGTALAQTLIKQPVKEAVREALAEDHEGQRDRSAPDRGAPTDMEPTDMGGGSSGGSSRSGILRRLLMLAAIAGVGYYAMQRRGIDIEDELSEEVGMGDTSGPSVEDPLSSDDDESDDAREEETDEGPTTRS